MQKTLILFGVKGSGKDTIGSLLRDRYGLITDSFADPIKKMVKIAFPDMTDEDLWGPSENREREYKQYPMGDVCLKCGSTLFDDDEGRLSCAQPDCHMQYPHFLTPRIACQTLGTEWGRRLYTDVWIDNVFIRARRAHEAWKSVIAQAHTPPPILVITDGRYPNEQARCTKLGATTILLLRKLDESTSTHSSETSLLTISREHFQYVLDNRCPLEELPALVGSMMKDLGIAR
jgi:hypothetical protein